MYTLINIKLIRFDQRKQINHYQCKRSVIVDLFQFKFVFFFQVFHLLLFLLLLFLINYDIVGIVYFEFYYFLK